MQISKLFLFLGAVSDVEMQEHYDEFFEVSFKHAHTCMFVLFVCFLHILFNIQPRF